MKQSAAADCLVSAAEKLGSFCRSPKASKMPPLSIFQVCIQYSHELN